MWLDQGEQRVWISSWHLLPALALLALSPSGPGARRVHRAHFVLTCRLTLGILAKLAGVV